jgi:hypothetical protein
MNSNNSKKCKKYDYVSNNLSPISLKKERKKFALIFFLRIFLAEPLNAIGFGISLKTRTQK